MEVGINYPPFHLNCRTTTIPYFEPDEIDEEFGIGTRLAKDKDGKYYEVPANLTYKEWKAGLTEHKGGNENYTASGTTNSSISPENLLNKLNVNPDNYRIDTNNNIQEKAAELLGMNNNQKILSEKEFNQLKGTQIYRYIRNNESLSNLKYSNINDSEYGKGIYFGGKSAKSGLDDIYAEKRQLIIGKLSPNANILEFNTKLDYTKDIENRIKNLPSSLQRLYTKESSLLYMLEGYDGIKINKKDYYCIYNKEILNIKE